LTKTDNYYYQSNSSTVIQMIMNKVVIYKVVQLQKQC